LGEPLANLVESAIISRATNESAMPLGTAMVRCSSEGPTKNNFQFAAVRVVLAPGLRFQEL
jgi:hypothetical protein